MSNSYLEELFPELGSVVSQVDEVKNGFSEETKGNEVINPRENDEDDNIFNVNHGELNIIESLCMNCEENGQTRLLFTKIPFFREIIISSFDCEHCNSSNNEVF